MRDHDAARRDRSADVTRASRLYQAQPVARSAGPLAARSPSTPSREPETVPRRVPRPAAEPHPAPAAAGSEAAPSRAGAAAIPTTVLVAARTDPGAIAASAAPSPRDERTARSRRSRGRVLVAAVTITCAALLASRLGGFLPPGERAAEPQVVPEPAKRLAARADPATAEPPAHPASELAPAPARTGGDRAAAEPPAAALEPRQPQPRSPEQLEGVAPAPRAAAELLARGRYRDALAAYRSLAHAAPGRAAYAHVARVLERRLTRHCERRAAEGGAPCKDESR